MSIPKIASPGGVWNTEIWWKTSLDQGCPANATGNSPGINLVTVVAMVLPFDVTIAKLSYTIATVFSGGAVNFGFYDVLRNKLIDSGALSTTTGGTFTVTLGSPVTLKAGVYYVAVSCDNLTAKINSFSGDNTWLTFDRAMNRSRVRWGVATNPTVAGVMPATLGTLTNLGSTLQTHPYQILWEAA